MRTKIAFALGWFVILATLTGCASYYMVTDPSSNKVYYTKDMERNKSGSIVFEDASTGNEVTLQNSEVRRINKSLYKANTP